MASIMHVDVMNEVESRRFSSFLVVGEEMAIGRQAIFN